MTITSPTLATLPWGACAQNNVVIEGSKGVVALCVQGTIAPLRQLSVALRPGTPDHIHAYSTSFFLCVLATPRTCSFGNLIGQSELGENEKYEIENRPSVWLSFFFFLTKIGTVFLFLVLGHL